MKRFYLILFLGFILVATFSSLLLSNISSASITNLIPQKIEKSNLSIGLSEVVQIPVSGTAESRVARLNFLTNAGDGNSMSMIYQKIGQVFMRARLQVVMFTGVKQYQN